MLLSIPSIAILSLFATTGHAFAPPTSTASIRTSRLYASSELSGLLNEYSGSTAPKAAAKVVEKVADVVVTPPLVTPPPPPVTPPPPPPSEIAESVVDSVVKAASVAQDAADQATAAAAAVASKGVAATKAAAVAGTTVAGGLQFKPLIGSKGVFVPSSPDTRLSFQVDPSKVSADNHFDASARAQENLAILKANFLEGIGAMKEGAGDLSSKTSSVDLNIPNVGTVSIAPSVADIIASLHLKEYGGWYAALAMAMIASQQRTAGADDASAKFELELESAREKASEAASAAGVAAEGAKTAKQLAMKMEKDLKKDSGKALLESSRSKMAEMEKSMMEKEMRALQAEVASLRSQLEKAEGGKKKAGPKKTTVKTEIESEYPSIFVMESDPEEDVRIVDLLKAMDEENAIKKKKAAEELEKKREEEAKFVAAQKIKAESKKMTKGVEAAQKQAEAAKKKAVTKKAAKKKSATKAKTKRKAATKTVAKKAPKTEVATADDWASLAESTLKRKTVAQLSEYLTGKGVTVTDGSGKSLKKAELLAAVKGL